jgi:predicted metalloprotease
MRWEPGPRSDDLEDRRGQRFGGIGVLFRDGVQSARGIAQTATGPFYCPGDHKVYIDLAFYDELGRRFGAPGDFAQTYVLAHEIGTSAQRASWFRRGLQSGRIESCQT